MSLLPALLCWEPQGASGLRAAPLFVAQAWRSKILRWADKTKTQRAGAGLWSLALIGASKASAQEGVLSRGLVNGTDAGGRADKSWGVKRVENQGISRFRTQRAGQALQMRPPLQASAVCLCPSPPLCALTESHIHGFRAGWKPSAGGLAIPFHGLTGGREVRWWCHGETSSCLSLIALLRVEHVAQTPITVSINVEVECSGSDSWFIQNTTLPHQAGAVIAASPSSSHYHS